MEMDHCKIEGMVPRRFHRWMKVFGKVESERMLVRKVWDHAIDLREEFVPSKARVYCYDLPWTGLLTSGDDGCH